MRLDIKVVCHWAQNSQGETGRSQSSGGLSPQKGGSEHDVRRGELPCKKSLAEGKGAKGERITNKKRVKRKIWDSRRRGDSHSFPGGLGEVGVQDSQGLPPSPKSTPQKASKLPMSTRGR